MNSSKERRQWERDDTNLEPGLGVIHSMYIDQQSNLIGTQESYPFFVGIHNQSQKGILINSPRNIDIGSRLCLSCLDLEETTWQLRWFKAIWNKENKSNYLVGLEAAGENETVPEIPSQAVLEDTRFILATNFMSSIPRHDAWPLLNCLKLINVEADAKIINQGDPGDCIFLIQEGECVVMVEKDSEMLPVARLKAGELVGEMAVLTSEPRFASVFAKTSMKLWKLDRNQFEEVSEKHPDLRIFLTELVSNRLESSKITSDRVIGKYQINYKLGQGAWGIVYQGSHALLNKTVAIKMLKHTMAMDEDFHARFKQEAKIIAQLNHQNIVHVYDIEERYRTLFIVMELLEGESVEDILARQGRIPHDLAIDYLVQTCAGLAYAHEQGIVHQDIKPGNLQVLPDNSIKILDFGLACDIGSENFDMEGTAFYMSPEQIESEPVDGRTDVYCLGITAYEMATGQRPYPEDDIAALFNMHAEQDIPDPRLLAPDIPEELQRFIIKACSRNPAERYQDMNEARDALLPYFEKHGQRGDDTVKEKQQITALFFLHSAEHVGPLTELLEEVSIKAQKIGVTMRSADIKNL